MGTAVGKTVWLENGQNGVGVQQTVAKASGMVFFQFSNDIEQTNWIWFNTQRLLCKFTSVYRSSDIGMTLTLKIVG